MKRLSPQMFLMSLALVVGLMACAPSSRKDDKINVTQEVMTFDQELKVGDIIFHKSRSQQSKAIKEASGSDWTHVGILISKNGEWYVAEAVGPVVSTKLTNFINRGKNKDYKIYRFKHFDADTMKTKLIEAIKQQNKPYDIYFEFSDEKTYCSELVYKAMLSVTGHELGQIQKFKDLKLDGRHVKDLIRLRLTEQSRELDPEEFIITPVSQMLDPNLTLIKESINN